MTIWILNEASSIPGVPSGSHPNGGVCVEVNDANEVVGITPLVQPPHDAPTADNPASASEDETKSEPEQVAEAEQ